MLLRVVLFEHLFIRLFFRQLNFHIVVIKIVKKWLSKYYFSYLNLFFYANLRVFEKKSLIV